MSVFAIVMLLFSPLCAYCACYRSRRWNHRSNWCGAASVLALGVMALPEFPQRSDRQPEIIATEQRVFDAIQERYQQDREDTDDETRRAAVAVGTPAVWVAAAVAAIDTTRKVFAGTVGGD